MMTFSLSALLKNQALEGSSGRRKRFAHDQAIVMPPRIKNEAFWAFCQGEVNTFGGKMSAYLPRCNTVDVADAVIKQAADQSSAGVAKEPGRMPERLLGLFIKHGHDDGESRGDGRFSDAEEEACDEEASGIVTDGREHEDGSPHQTLSQESVGDILRTVKSRHSHGHGDGLAYPPANHQDGRRVRRGEVAKVVYAAGPGILLAREAKVFAEAHDGGGTESRLVKVLEKVADSHDGQQAEGRWTTISS